MRIDYEHMAVTRRLILAVLLITAGGCGITDPAPDHAPFEARIDSVVAPSSILASDSLRFEVFGFLGNTLCWEFDRLESHRDVDRLTLTALGLQLVTEGVVCPAALAFFRVQVVEPPPFAAPHFDFFAEQGGTLEFLVRVEVR